MAIKWDRDSAIRRAEPRLWRYLSGNSTSLNVARFAEEVLTLPSGELQRLAATHLALSPISEAMIEAANPLLRALPASASRSEVEVQNRVEGPISWQKTLARRAATRDPSRLIVSIPERRYDTWLGRLVKHSLLSLVALHTFARLGDRGATSATLAERARVAQAVLGHAKLREVKTVARIPERVLQGIRRHRDSAPFVKFNRAFRDAIDSPTREAIREVIAARVLAPATDDRLFELIVGFEIIDAMEAIGYREVNARLLPNRRIPFARFNLDRTFAELWWQTPIWQVFESSSQSRYREALKQAGMSRSTLRPDFVLRISDNALMIEVKQTGRENMSPDREGIREALAYVKDAEAMLATKTAPHALVVAWNSLGRPAAGQILVADQDGIADSLAVVLAQWEQSSGAI